MEAGLHHLTLPPRINQGDPALAAHYARKTYTTRKGVTFTGSPIIYTVTIPSTAHHMEGALAFVRYLLGEAGQALLAREGLRPVPPVLSGELGALPAPLRSLVRGP